MKHYGHFGFKEFAVALGYKGEYIKRWFLDYHSLSGNISVALGNGSVQVDQRSCEDWMVHLRDTGANTATGGRVKRIESLLCDEPFMVTYGDGVADIDLHALLAFHRRMGKTATITAVRPPARYGGLAFDGDNVTQFVEKPQIGEGWINGGYMVLEPGIFKYLNGDRDSLEVNLLEKLAFDKQLAAYRHPGFWQCMDTLRDKNTLEAMWERGSPPWKVWS